jgi:hypothetical protein
MKDIGEITISILNDTFFIFCVCLIYTSKQEDFTTEKGAQSIARFEYWRRCEDRDFPLWQSEYNTIDRRHMKLTLISKWHQFKYDSKSVSSSEEIAVTSAPIFSNNRWNKSRRHCQRVSRITYLRNVSSISFKIFVIYRMNIWEFEGGDCCSIRWDWFSVTKFSTSLECCWKMRWTTWTWWLTAEWSDGCWKIHIFISSDSSSSYNEKLFEISWWDRLGLPERN